jgi:hypothetical protein
MKQQTTLETHLDDFFKTEPIEPQKMSQKDFIQKTKEVFGKICDSYSNARQRVALCADEYPDENVCSKCKGFGKFMYNGEEKECIMDREREECFHTHLDYKQVGMDLETHFEDMIDLLSVNVYIKL